MEEASSTLNLELSLWGVGWSIYDFLQLLDEFVEDEDVHDTKHNQKSC